MKILKKKILLALSLPVDFFKRREGFVYRPYSFLYYFLPKFRQGSIRDAIGQLVKSREVDKIVRNNVPYFRVTGVGRERLLSFFPISLGQSRVWDRRWRIAIINSKFKMQNIKLGGGKIERRLKEFSFRRLGRGVYITPMPISEKLKEYLLREKLLGQVVVIESRRLLGGEDKNLAKEIWKLEKSVKEYNDFIKKCKGLLKKVNVKKRLISQGEEKVVWLFDSYFSLLSCDPGLPKKVLPDDWPGDFAREIVLNFFERLENGKLLDIF